MVATKRKGGPCVHAQVRKRFRNRAEHEVLGECGGLSMEKFVLESMLVDLAHQADQFQKRRVHLTYEYALQGETAGAECVGDKRVRRMREALAYLDTKGFSRSKQQKVMHEAFLAVSYSAYYGKSIARHLTRLLRESGFSELRQEALVLAPRRYGKTVSICLFNAAELVTQPDHDILIYSNNHRASKMMLLQTYRCVRILQANEEFGGKVTSLNKNESMTYDTQDGYTNELFAYPAKPDNLRGTGSKRKTGSVILEEMAYIPLDLVLEIVAPTLTVANKILRAITTVKGADSFVGPMAEAKFPDGRSVFLTLNFELVCNECKRKGIPEKCKCLEGDIPHWQSASNHEKLAVLMKGRIETFMKEIRGYSMDQTVMPAFDRDAVKFLMTPESVLQSGDLYSPTVYLAVDPACNGKYSKVAIMSAIFLNDRMVITGIDSIKNLDNNLHYTVIVEHIRRVRALRGLANANIVFSPETNLGGEATRLVGDLIRARVPNVYVMQEDSKQPGVRMTNDLKKLMWVEFKRALNERTVRFHPNMIVSDEKQTPAALRKMFVDELGTYTRKLEYDKNNQFKVPKEFFTGKALGGCDDHAIVGQLLFVSRMYYEEKREFYRQQGPIWHRGMVSQQEYYGSEHVRPLVSTFA